ncbi:AbiV family abortive infection protein [Bradyrhizobium sp. SZCCHNS2015]|uniref:AbiV family abortive infection protein n=1 Tax=Bradyrhizobium sp. SZCCHNS2015 TaxID=3057305 RepID=UPI0028E5A0C6|nr:AbiV family abortive infection protein [Bradyrhizobium sp. SZCCHNS2015]
MDEKVLLTRRLCLEQAESFITASERLTPGWPHIVYHLSLLALEEIGKASMITARAVQPPDADGAWIDRSLENHRRKLQWAVWSPMLTIDPKDFQAAKDFAERVHAVRLATLYVDPATDLTDLPPRERVTHEDAEKILDLARARLETERTIGAPTLEPDELTEWFIDSMADPDRSSILLSAPFRAQYETLNGDARAWANWARNEIAKLDMEAQQLLEAELARPAAPMSSAKQKWRAKSAVYTPSHSLRAKVLAKWNEHIEPVQLLWIGKKDELTLQITLHDNMPLAALFGRLTTLAKLTVACLNIGSAGYFWFQRAGFEQRMFKEVRDLERHRPIDIRSGESFWGDGRAVALSDSHIDNAMHCMMAFAPLSEVDAEPIFAPYFHGLAMISKSDTFYRFDDLARHEFVRSLAGALQRYGNWNGKAEDFEERLHQGFAPFMPDPQHRDRLFKALRTIGDPDETPLVNLRSAKQLADLYLIHTAKRTWRTILHRKDDKQAKT